MIKVLWCRFQQCLGTFTMLLVEGSSKLRLLTHLYDYVFGVRNFGNAESVRVISFSKYLKFKRDIKKAPKTWENAFCFWDNCILTGIVKLSLLRTGYLSSASNVLTSTPKIWHVNKRDFFQLNWLGSDHWIWSRCSNANFNGAWARFPCCLSRDTLKRDFLNIYLITFSKPVILERQNLWGSSFFSKCVQFNVHFKNAWKNC